MRTLISCLIAIVSANVFAAPLEAVDCKREIIASALSERTKNSTLEFLLSSTYEVTDFNYLDTNSGYGNYEYVVTTLSTSRVDGTTVTTSYGANVIDIKSCAVQVKMLAD